MNTVCSSTTGNIIKSVRNELFLNDTVILSSVLLLVLRRLINNGLFLHLLAAGMG